MQVFALQRTASTWSWRSTCVLSFYFCFKTWDFQAVQTLLAIYNLRQGTNKFSIIILASKLNKVFASVMRLLDCHLISTSKSREQVGLGERVTACWSDVGDLWVIGMQGEAWTGKTSYCALISCRWLVNVSRQFWAICMQDVQRWRTRSSGVIGHRKSSGYAL